MGVNMGEVIPFVKHGHTMNIAKGDGFHCMACGHWTWEPPETEWGDLFVCEPKRFNGHIHGREPWHFCSNCGAMILTLSEWADAYPQDQGKTTSEIEKRFY